jgi:glutathione peroxidase
VPRLPYDAPVETSAGTTTTLGGFEGKAILIVNVASKCGSTPQYEQLEQLQQRFGHRGLQVLGFPCNQFAGQEPGSNEEIAEFCALNYGVTFPIMAKVKVNGRQRHEIFEAIREKKDANGRAGVVKWNFEKFLIAPGGEVVGRFRTPMKPDDPAIIQAIEGVLPA